MTDLSNIPLSAYYEVAQDDEGYYIRLIDHGIILGESDKRYDNKRDAHNEAKDEGVPADRILDNLP